MTKFSLLDLVPVVEGGNVATALANAADLAVHAESLGFVRYWVAEHHGMRGIASAATSVVIGHIAAATKTIRVGSGGIMLPNHSPLVIAEQFGTLDALYPGRIDLGLGRAPGSDQRVAAAIRRTLDSDPNAFPRDVMELQSYFADDGQTGIVATPGAGADVQLYILGSSLYGAQVAGALGLPFAFASHFAPDMLDEALHIYRSHFRPKRRAGRTLRDGGVQHHRRRNRRRGRISRQFDAAKLRLAAHRQPPPDAAAGRRLSRVVAAVPRGDAGQCVVGERDWSGGYGEGRRCGVYRADEGG